MITGNQVGAAAARLLDGQDTSAGYRVSVPLPPDVTPAAAQEMAAMVLSIDAVSSDPQTAAAAANAYAQAFVDHRKEAAREQVSSLLAAVKARLLSSRTPASRRGLEYAELARSEEALQLQLETLTADYEVTVTAAPPPIPFYPTERQTLVKFIALGLILGTGFAFLLENLDTRPRDEREMAESLGLPVIGRLPPLSSRKAETAAPQMLTNPLGRVAEGVRELRGNLGFASVDGEVRTLLFSSSVRGEGKSVTACNLAVAMALVGRRVVLVDADLRHPSVHAHMHLANAIGLSSVLSRRANLADALVPVAVDQETGGADTEAATGVTPPLGVTPPGPDAIPVLRVMPAGPVPPNPGEMAASERFGATIRKLADTADIVIVDSPPLLEAGDATAMALRVDGLIFVTNMKRARWPALEHARTRLVQMPCRLLGLVVVQAERALDPKHGYSHSSVANPADNQRRA